MQVLAESTWRPRAAAHDARVGALVAEHVGRRREGVKHPVHDFLFTYYSFRPAQLRRWHPGHGVALAGASERLQAKGYAQQGAGAVAVSEEHVATQRTLLEQTRALLVATAARAPQFGCFGLHEWAMVHGSTESGGGSRHDWPLRLGGAGTDQVVESHRIACSHFDAFRFFTATARPLNTLQPGPDDRPAYEQPACLHGNMDLYKHAFRLTPMVPAELVADCFELARDIRVLDMRASPYDLRGLGLEPVRIETPQGKAEYAAAQRGFADRARPLRARLAEECERLLAVPGVRSGHG